MRQSQIPTGLTSYQSDAALMIYSPLCRSSAPQTHTLRVSAHACCQHARSARITLRPRMSS